MRYFFLSSLCSRLGVVTQRFGPTSPPSNIVTRSPDQLTQPITFMDSWSSGKIGPSVYEGSLILIIVIYNLSTQIRPFKVLNTRLDLQ